MNILKPFLLCLAILLFGCTTEPDPGEDGKVGDKGAIEQAVEAQQVPKQKAQDLEQQLQDAHEQQKKEIDEQSDGG